MMKAMNWPCVVGGILIAGMSLMFEYPSRLASVLCFVAGAGFCSGLTSIFHIQPILKGWRETLDLLKDCDTNGKEKR